MSHLLAAIGSAVTWAIWMVADGREFGEPGRCRRCHRYDRVRAFLCVGCYT